jgi:predicted ATPase
MLQDGVWPVAMITGDLETAARVTTTMIDWATKIDAPLWKMVGNCWNGQLLIEHGEFERGVELVSQAIEACERTGWLRGYAELLGHLAEGLVGLGKLDAALDAIERAIDRAAHSGEAWHQPELMRVKGEILLQQSERTQTAEAEDCFHKAIELARAQGALVWELRIALSLARVHMTKGRPERARQLLASVYDCFTEGFAATDMQAARILLDGLRS